MEAQSLAEIPIDETMISETSSEGDANETEQFAESDDE